MERSQSIATLAAALVAAQAELENATKNATNPHFKNRYADLAAIIEAVKPVLASHGIAVIQLPAFEEGVVSVETILLHKSGEWMSGIAGAPAQKMDPQGVGSAITYLRRYSLAAACNIAQEDDDGAAASRPTTRKQEPKPQQNEGATDEQLAQLFKLEGEDVFTDAEIAALRKSRGNSPTHKKAATQIEWLTKELAARTNAGVMA